MPLKTIKTCDHEVTFLQYSPSLLVTYFAWSHEFFHRLKINQTRHLGKVVDLLLEYDSTTVNTRAHVKHHFVTFSWVN